MKYLDLKKKKKNFGNFFNNMLILQRNILDIDYIKFLWFYCLKIVNYFVCMQSSYNWKNYNLVMKVFENDIYVFVLI